MATAQSTPRRMWIPVGVNKGMYAAGDPANIPDGYAASIRNIFVRPNGLEFRSPVTDDSLAADVVGLMIYEDINNLKTRFLALQYSVGTVINLYTKTDGSEGWTNSASFTAAAHSRLIDYTNYNSVIYFFMDDGAGTPAYAFSWDGTTLSSTPFNSTIVGTCIASFGDRIFIGGPRVTTTALGTATTNSYDWTNATNWPATNVNATFVTLGSGVKVCRLAPTSTAASACSIKYNPTGSGLISVAASTSTQPYVWRGDFRGNDPVYRVPFTMEWVLVNDRANTTAYALGDMIASGGYRYRCTTAGTSAGAPPALTTTIGASTVDGTATWTNEGTDVLQSYEDRFYTATDGWITFSVECSVPARTNTVYITPRLKFYNSSYTATTTLAAVDISLKDGIADGGSGKANKGQQWTLGSYRYPFFNKESANTATFNLEAVVWSEIGDPKTIRALNYYQPHEIAGVPTALFPFGGRLILFKRRAMWQFSLTNDPDIPIQADGPARPGFGCLNPRAISLFEDKMYWIGEDEVYRARLGWPPEPLCGDAMRSTVMNKNYSSWAETSVIGPAAALPNVPLLTIDRSNREVWVYTQNPTSVSGAQLHCLNLPTGAWTYHDDGVFAPLALLYNPVREKVYLSASSKGLGRFDSANNTQDGFGGSGQVTAVTQSLTTRNVQLKTPQYDLMLEESRVNGKSSSTAIAGGPALMMTYTFGQGGTTYTKFYQAKFGAGFQNADYAPMAFPAYLSGPYVSLTLSCTDGKTGSGILSFSDIALSVNVKRGVAPQALPTSPTSG